MNNRFNWIHLAMAGLLPLVAACGDSVAPPGTTEVTVSFAGMSSSTAPATGPAAAPAYAPARSAVIEGTNGVLEIAEIHMIVAELELEGSEGACEAVTEDSDDDGECPDFEAPPAFIQIPLDGTGVEVATSAVPVGTYGALEFEVEDISFDEDDEDEQELTELRNEVFAAFPDWPSQASLVVIGTFTPTGGDPVPFTTFFEAEVEVETVLDPALVLDEAGASREVFVQLMPEVWFTNADGSVMDLSSFQDELRSLEVEIEEGIEVEHD